MNQDEDRHERQLLACLLGGPANGSVDAYLDVAEYVKPEDMADLRHEMILWTIYRLHDEHLPVNAITVGDRLGKDVKRAGGVVYLNELAGEYVTASNAVYYAEKVRIQSGRRSLAMAATRLQQVAAEMDAVTLVDLQNTIDGARGFLDGVALRDRVAYDGPAASFRALEALDGSDGSRPVPTPWHELDAALGGGWRRGALYYVGARPAVGKSLLGMLCSLDMARRGSLSYLASMEMPDMEVRHRMLSTVTGIDAMHIQARDTFLQTPQAWAQLSDATQRIASLPLVIDDANVQSPATMRARLRNLMRERGPLGLVVIDYVQLMDAVVPNTSRQQEITSISRALKVMAQEFDVPVVVLSQLNRNGASGKPSMTDLRESGSLEQDGDVVMLLHVEEEAPDILEIDIPKNRHGRPNGWVRLNYQPHLMRLSERRTA